MERQPLAAPGSLRSDRAAPLAAAAAGGNGGLAPGGRPAHDPLQMESTVDWDYEVNSPTNRFWKVSEPYVKAALGGSLAVAVVLAVALSIALARQATAATFEINFLVVGDWGREGGSNQSEVASLMAWSADSLRPQFVISTGDNMYPHGLNSTDDPRFDASFTSVYSAGSLQVPWHAVLGNHDYGDGDYFDDAGREVPSCLNSSWPCNVSPMYQLGGTLVNRDPRWHCERQYTLQLAGGAVELFFIDTTPFVLKYRSGKEKVEWAQYAGGLLEQSWEAQLRELEGQLAASSAPWKLAIGHHPPHSNGHHGNTDELIQHVEPLFKQYGVQAYFAGHDHSLEHLYVDAARYHIFVSGAGSQCQRSFSGQALSRYQWPSSGFVAATLTNHELRVEFYHLEAGKRADYVATVPRVPPKQS